MVIIHHMVEMFVRVRVFMLAAYLALVEFWFDLRYIKKVKAQVTRLPQASRTALVTGASGTIGSQVVKDLVSLGFHVHAVVNSDAEMYDEVIPERENVTLHEIDFGEPAMVVSGANNIKRSMGSHFHLLIFCAGVMFVEERRIMAVEEHMCVNLVCQALLLECLQTKMARQTRILFLSSAAARCTFLGLAPNIEAPLRSYIGPYQAYSFSKFLLTVYVEETARRRNWDIACVHPGVVPGGLYRHTNIFIRIVNCFILPLFMRSAKSSSVLVLHTAMREDFEAGKYYENTLTRDITSRLCPGVRRDLFDAVDRQAKAWRRKYKY